MKFLCFFLILFWCTTRPGQSFFSSAKKIYKKTTPQKDISLIVISDTRCGYCHLLHKRLLSDSLDLKVNIKIYDMSPDSLLRKRFQNINNRFDIFSLQDEDSCAIKFIPISYLYDERRQKTILKI